MNPESQPLYLSSLDSARFEPVRVCQIVDIRKFGSGKDAVVATLDPGVPGQDFGSGEDIDTVILATRFEGASINPIDKFPCFVFIAIPAQGRPLPASPIRSDDLQIIGWGELYRSSEDATSHKFG